MSSVNLYATLADYKAYSVARGQAASTDATDDIVIVDLLEQASRYLDEKTARQYYPTIETRVYDVPSSRELRLRADLLSVISLTNGDGTAIASDQYVLESANNTPYWKLKLRSYATDYWLPDTANGIEQAVELNGWFGYRERFAQRAWQSVGTLGAAITDTTTLAFTMATGHTVVPNQILKVDSEIYNVSVVATDTITPVVRGDNGSTAATHSNGATVYKWVSEENARGAVLEIAHSAYQRRTGKNTGESATITGAGIVLTPRDIPKMAEEFIRTHMRRV
jgi:hypothetical protein